MYLIVGGAGYLGTNLIEAVLEKTDEAVCATARNIPPFPPTSRICWEACDIEDRDSVDRLADKLAGESLKVVVCAAFHHPDAVQQQPRKAWNVNVTSLSYLLNRLENVKRLFYPSTDSVYGESEGGHHFQEGDKTTPVNIYGRQKTVAEQLVNGYGYNVARFPFLIGPSLVPGKPHFYDRIAETILRGEPMEMFQDSYRSTLSFASAARFVVDLMEMAAPVPQIINICGDDDLSKYDVGLMIARKLNVPKDLIVPISISGKQGIFETARAQSTLMDNSLLKSVLGLKRIELEL